MSWSCRISSKRIASGGALISVRRDAGRGTCLSINVTVSIATTSVVTDDFPVSILQCDRRPDHFGYQRHYDVSSSVRRLDDSV